MKVPLPPTVVAGYMGNTLDEQHGARVLDIRLCLFLVTMGNIASLLEFCWKFASVPHILHDIDCISQE